MRNTATEHARMLERADREVEAIFSQITAAENNGFEADPETPAGSDTQFWYRTDRSRLVLRGLDGSSLHVFTGPIEARGTVLSFSIHFDGNIPGEAFEAAIRGAM